MNSIKLIGFATLVFLSFYFNGIEKKIIGNWEYQYSLIDNKPQKIEFDIVCPVQKMSFQKCNDQKDMQKMPEIVRNLRKNNSFKNISCKTYNNGKLIENYFPVISPFIKEKDTTYIIDNYGNRLKSDYYIDKIANDTLIINDGKVYNISGKENYRVKHIYVMK